MAWRTGLLAKAAALAPTRARAARGNRMFRRAPRRTVGATWGATWALPPRYPPARPSPGSRLRRASGSLLRWRRPPGVSPESAGSRSATALPLPSACRAGGGTAGGGAAATAATTASDRHRRDGGPPGHDGCRGFVRMFGRDRWRRLLGWRLAPALRTGPCDRLAVRGGGRRCVNERGWREVAQAADLLGPARHVQCRELRLSGLFRDHVLHHRPADLRHLADPGAGFGRDEARSRHREHHHGENRPADHDGEIRQHGCDTCCETADDTTHGADSRR